MKHSGLSIFALLASPMLLSACSMIGSAPGMDRLVGEEGIFRDREAEYLEAETIARIDVPPGLDSYMIDDLLVIPDLPNNEGRAYLEVPRPRPLGRNVSRGVVIQRMDDSSWAVVDASANQVWPRILEFWEDNNIGLTLENPAGGVMETAWFVWDEDRGTEEKVRLIVEPGFQDDSAEVSLVQISSPRDEGSPQPPANWPSQSMDSALEYDLLSQLSTYIAEVAGLYQASSVSLMAGNIPSEGRATLITNTDNEHLRLDAGYERGWAAVGRALERAGVQIASENADEGFYQVFFDSRAEGERPGFFGRLLGQGNDAIVPLRVNVSNEGSVVNVTVDATEALDGDAPPATVNNAQNMLLTLISEFIS